MDTSHFELVILEIEFVRVDRYTCQNTGYNENSQPHLDAWALNSKEIYGLLGINEITYDFFNMIRC